MKKEKPILALLKKRKGKKRREKDEKVGNGREC
jgi:hypothetical protein